MSTSSRGRNNLGQSVFIFPSPIAFTSSQPFNILLHSLFLSIYSTFLLSFYKHKIFFLNHAREKDHSASCVVEKELSSLIPLSGIQFIATGHGLQVFVLLGECNGCYDLLGSEFQNLPALVFDTFSNFL